MRNARSKKHYLPEMNGELLKTITLKKATFSYQIKWLLDAYALLIFLLHTFGHYFRLYFDSLINVSVRLKRASPISRVKIEISPFTATVPHHHLTEHPYIQLKTFGLFVRNYQHRNIYRKSLK